MVDGGVVWADGVKIILDNYLFLNIYARFLLKTLPNVQNTAVKIKLTTN